MKKLNNSEIDVLVNEIIDEVKSVKLSKVKELLEVDSDYKEIIKLYKKLYDLKKIEDELENEINSVNKVINEKFRVRICKDNGYYRKDYLLDNLFVSFNYKDEEKYSYVNVRNKIILNNISNEINVKEFIKKFVDEYIN